MSHSISATFVESEALYRGLFETAPDAVVVVDSEDNIVLANGQVEKLFGYLREELLGQPIETLTPKRFHRRHPGYRSSLSHKEEAISVGANMDLWGLRQDGTEFPVEISLSPLETEGGMLVASAIRDISDRHRAERKFQTVVESAPDAMVVVNGEGTMVLVNAQAEKMFGHRRDELLGQPIGMLIPERFREGRQDITSFFSESGLRPMGTSLEWHGVRKDGGSFPVEISLSPLETEEGALVCGVIRDVTERKEAAAIKRLNQALEKRTTELEAANKELEAFTYSVSHDLRAPLRHIDGFSKLVLEEASRLSPDAQEYLRDIRSSTRQMGQLVDDLLNLARVSRRELAVQVTGLGPLVGEVVSELQRVRENRVIEWRVGKLPFVECDPGLIKQVFVNLLSNAVKFTRPREIRTIEVGATVSYGRPVIFVRDNGVGFNDKNSAKLFGVFQRLHRQEDFEGTGVGLATVQRIVHKHGGKVWAEAELDRGATFFFTLGASQETASTDPISTGATL
jgi:PAS domain S-box-containing protein